MDMNFLKSYVGVLSGNQAGAPFLAFSDLLDQSAQGYFYGFSLEDLLKAQDKTIKHLESITDISEFTLEKIFDPYQDEAIAEIKAAYKYGFRTAAEMIQEVIRFIDDYEARKKKPENLGQ